MPSNEDYFQQAVSYKDQGNAQFGAPQTQTNYLEAIQCYSQGIVLIDRIPESVSSVSVSASTSSSAANAGAIVLLKWTLLSNRALARIKQYETTTNTSRDDDHPLPLVLLQDAIDDCQSAITSMSSTSSGTAETNALRAKLLYRSAKARFLAANHPNNTSSSSSTTTAAAASLFLQEAAKDLLVLFQMDPKHVEGNRLMTMIRTQHQQANRDNSSDTPVGKVLSTLVSTLSTESTTSSSSSTSSTATQQQQQQIQQLKLLYSLIQNDPIHSSMQIGRYIYHHPVSSSTEPTTTTTSTHNGVAVLWQIIISGIPSMDDVSHSMMIPNPSAKKSILLDHVSLLGLQCISSMASQHPLFIRMYLTKSYQSSLMHLSESMVQYLISTTNSTTSATSTSTMKILCDLMVSILSVWHSIILHADRDHTTSSSSQDMMIVGTTQLHYNDLLHTLSYALQMGQYCYTQQQQQQSSDPSSTPSTQSTLLYRAVMDVVSVFLASSDRDHRIRMSLMHHTNTNNNSSSSHTNIHAIDPELEPIRTPQEVRNMTPPQLAAYKKRQYDIKTRNEAWAYERAKFICTNNITVTTSSSNRSDDKDTATAGGPTLFRHLLTVAVSYCHADDIIFRREMTISISRILSCLEPDTMIHDMVRPYLQQPNETSTTIKEEPYIEEIYDDDHEEGKSASVEEIESSNTVVTLETKMMRAVIATAILLLSSKKECATWVLSNDGWNDVSNDVPDLIASQQIIALCYVVEMIQAAAVLEATRAVVTSLISSGAMESLMKSTHRDVRSGAAAAIAKLGLSNKVTSKDDGELMGLLQAACELFEDRDDIDLIKGDNTRNESKDDQKNGTNSSSKYNQYSSYATSSVERAVEMITYLVAHTTIKDEIAAGFGGSSGRPVIDLLVQAADQPGAGESMSGFSLASIFQLLAATNEQIRREAFEGKEVTMDQYDEMQRMGKTEEEKEIMDQEKDTDTKEACQERIRKMAHANVPRALVALTENASEHTLEQLTMALNRMADEASVRGILIQQGVLSTCIKIEKAEGPTETDIMKKVIRMARHCIAKMLVTTNPSLLTSAQKLGAVKPLILLIRDIRASDLQHFEALLAVTNIGSSGDDAKNRIVSERGIATFHFAMFSDHEMVRRSATEALCNLVPHEKMMEHLAEVDHLRLWLAFAVDYEDHYECARAATGCLAMATQDETIAQALVDLDKFKTQMTALLESGRLEIMHRAFVIVYNLVLHGSKIREATIAAGLIDFCRAYIELQQHGVADDEFSVEERNLIPVTVEIAKTIVQSADK